MYWKAAKWLIPVLGMAAAAAVARGQQAPVFHTQSDLVQVPVTVLGPKGTLVRGLTRKDFRLKVDGVPVKIEAVDPVKQPLPSEATVKAAATPPGVYSNQAEGQSPGRIVLLYDYDNTPLNDLPRLRLRLLHWFQHSMPPGQKVAVFAVNGGLDVLQPFTSNREALEATLQGMVTFHFLASRYIGLRQDLDALRRMGGAPADMGAGADWSPATLEQLNQLQTRNSYYDTVRALNDLASVLEGAPGRKAVIWLTAGTSFNQIWAPGSGLSGNRMRQAFSRLNQANVALFPVDVAGLQVLVLPPSTFNPSAPPDTTYASQNLIAHAWKVIAKNMVADETGGLAFSDSNDIGTAITHIIHLTSEGYALSFIPPPAGAVHPYHRLTLTVPGRKVKLLYRRQYHQPQSGQIDADAKNFARSLRRLAIEPMDMASVPLALRTLPPGPEKQAPWPGRKHGVRAREHRFVLLIPYRTLLHSVPDHKGVHAFDFTCARVLVPLDQPEQLVVFQQKRLYVHTLTDAQQAMLAGQAAMYRGAFPVPSGHLYLARVIVRDNLNGKIGSVSFRIDSRDRSNRQESSGGSKSKVTAGKR